MLILGIESSCDETAASVVRDGREILSNEIATQIAIHKKFGGVVPEIASRQHTEAIADIVSAALRNAGITWHELDAVAVTAAPGLIGALLVGVNFAKGFSLSTGKPLVPVHHIRGHIAANYLAHPDLKPPFLCLVASGGNSLVVMVDDYDSYRIIGRTHDDAAGEAFDKAARAMGLCYPGGVQIDRLSKEGDPKAIRLPHPKVDGCPYDFSFSGLKTAVINQIHNAEQKGTPLNLPDVAASFQKAVADSLTNSVMLAARDFGATTIVCAGGVSANSGLRSELEKKCAEKGYALYMPPLPLCGDNAAMIASQGYYEIVKAEEKGISPYASDDLNARATMNITETF